ncbi:hypothetical protein ONO86_05182 [Micromonospora noduli]|nr:hypothetical protein [Micromonospora noduli]RAO32877.1 hypothetical protein ONO86_05182 [Micromonospora noduli]
MGEAILLTTANAAVALIGLVIILLTALRDRSAARRDLASARAAH